MTKPRKPIQRTREEVIRRWVKALRSGDYTQARGALKKIDSRGNRSFCCLGVLCDLAAKDGGQPWDGLNYAGASDLPPGQVMDFIAGSWKHDPLIRLASDNDEGMPFERIADRIEKMFL